MGSPESEPERNSNETRHLVVISKAYYMQTTEMNQAQWKSVMGNNPSSFQGDTLPVERVSWNTITNEFLPKVASAKLVLPTEAQWEYACRAGTTTPFNLGANINTNQVNYDGNYSYNGAPKAKQLQ
jgi:formylglycine-generating enzyme required for sulfatase activity